MGDPEQGRQAKALENISHHMKELVKVMSTLNENFVGFVKKMDEPEKMSSESVDSPTFKKVRSKAFGLEGVVVREDEHGNTLILIQGVDLKWFPNDDLEDVD